MFVVVLLIVDVILVALALARTAPSTNGTTGPVPTFTSEPSPSPTAPTPSPSADRTGSDAAGPRFIAAIDGQEAWRASAGACGGTDGVLERTVDGGATWTRVSTGGEPGTVLSLHAQAQTVSVLIGTGSDCSPVVRSSSDGGRTWGDGAAGAAGAGIVPAGIVVSSGIVEAPCPAPRQVYEGDFTTAVVCRDQLQWRSGTGPWVGVPLAGVRSLADDGDAYLIATAGAAECEGVELRSLRAVGVTAASKTEHVGCAPDSDPDGAVVLARGGTYLWLWAGGTVAVSNDDGATW